MRMLSLFSGGGYGGDDMKIFLISPVAKSTDTNNNQVSQYVYKLERDGHEVHWPLRDTNQNDNIGNKVTSQNANAIRSADEVHIWYTQDSKGTHFDLGMAWILNKPLVIANDITDPGYKSYERLIRWWSKRE